MRTAEIDTSTRLIDVRQVAAIVGCSARHVANLDKTGRILRPLRLGRSVRWDRDAIDRWIDSGCPSRDAWESAQK
ncbi:unnamed protein product [marine sediment metagenome]|uniref:Helix-turn-helix domain-containing protein n=1 Tax=marine sediment metagenome TaxID=412755 RepID=X0TCN7_9ZZZZ